MAKIDRVIVTESAQKKLTSNFKLISTIVKEAESTTSTKGTSTKFGVIFEKVAKALILF
jgi:hypothetical protein